MPVLFLVALAVAAGVVRFVFPAGTPRIRGGTANSIAVLEKVRLGGNDQWILVRSEDVRNPIVLYVHGGPGASQLTSNRRDTRRLEKDFTVVTWDQRGAGKSYAAIRDTAKMNVGRFVEDRRELSLHLLEKFGQDKLVLVGHSWGSVVGALTASKYPELFHCYVGIGQIGNMVEGEATSYRWTLEQARKQDDRKAVATLEAIGPPPYTGDWRKKTIAERRLLGKFGGEYHGSRIGAFGHVFGGLLFSREYTLTDRFNYLRGVLGSMKLLWPQLMEVDFFTTLHELGVPVFFMEGRHDFECPSEIAARYFQVLEAPYKELVWFKNSAHLPNSEERDRFNRIMVEKVLPVASGRTA